MTPLDRNSAPLEKSILILDATYKGLIAKVHQTLIAPPDWVEKQVGSVQKILNEIPKELPKENEVTREAYCGKVIIQCECTKEGYKLIFRLRPESGLRRPPALSGGRVLQIAPKSSSSSEGYPFEEGTNLKEARNRRKHSLREPIIRDDTMFQIDEAKLHFLD